MTKKNSTESILNQVQHKGSAQSIFDYLYEQRFKKGIVPTLDRVLEIYKALSLDIDEKKLITIAGTNGKGSTTAILTSILEAHDKKVARFNSPHLYDITERFYFSDVKYRIKHGTGYINKENLEKILIKIKKVVDNYQNTHPYHFITFFEYMLLAGLVWFDSLNYDYIILEVGMGGRFDATNILDAKFGAITSISLDHISYLGDTIEKIAYEKAGIIKENQIVSIGNIPDIALEIIKDIVKEKNAKYIYSPKIDINEFNTESSSVQVIKKIKLKGKYQIHNIKTALSLSLSILEDNFDNNKFEKGVKEAYWPARYEKISNNPIIIRDVAHNVEGMLALKESLLEDYPNYKKIVIFSVMKDKDYKGMLSIIDSFSDFNIFVDLKMERSLSPEILKNLSQIESIHLPIDKTKGICKGESMYSPLDLNDKTMIIITGSIFLMEKIS